MKKALPLLLVLSLGVSALADHTVTMRTTMSDPNMASMKMTTVTRTKNKRQRVEDTTEMSGFKMNTVSLVMCDLEQTAQLDPENKIYTVSSMNPVASFSPDGEPAKPKKGTGTMSTHVKVQDKGVEKVAQVNARHWIVDTQTKGTGCIGTFDYKSTREFWTSDLPAFYCPTLAGTWTEQTFNDCQVKNTLTGDAEKYHQSMRHEVVKEIIYIDGKPSMTREMVDFSTALLDESLFSLDGYRKVSEEEFQAAQQQKMMKMYQQ